MVMKEKDQPVDRHLDTSSGSNRGKHVNFPEVQEESADIAEEASQNQSGSAGKNQSAMPMDSDDTRGIP